ncbi:hypothetical protein MKW92_050919 [Papaver armeniacum]|nr:hypothetical protein MKW92_050919 [Papaver armeniacum]
MHTIPSRLMDSLTTDLRNMNALAKWRPHPSRISALRSCCSSIFYLPNSKICRSIMNGLENLTWFCFIFMHLSFTIFKLTDVLFILVVVLLSIGEGTGKGSSGSDADLILFYGIIHVLVASVLSGFASSLCQWDSQVKKHSSYLMTVEMSVVGSMCLLASTYKSPDGEQIRKHGFFYGWTAFTLIPVLTNDIGGILVGLVTTHTAGVHKASRILRNFVNM